MSTMLVWREKLQRIYALYSIYIQKGLQFVTGLVLFWVINSNIGFMKPASSVFCTLGLAVICTFLPMTITVLAATALILAHFYALSLPIALVALVIFILMYIFYFRFTPKKAWLVLISGLAFSLKIPFVIPIAGVDCACIMRNYHLLYDRLCESIRGSAKGGRCIRYSG